jgi:hypothetical protein
VSDWKPNAVCPKCHRPPAVRYYTITVEWARTLEPDEPIRSHTCQTHGCGTIYVIAAFALQNATRDPLSRKALAVAKRAA